MVIIKYLEVARKQSCDCRIIQQEECGHKKKALGLLLNKWSAVVSECLPTYIITINHQRKLYGLFLIFETEERPSRKEQRRTFFETCVLKNQLYCKKVF